MLLLQHGNFCMFLQFNIDVSLCCGLITSSVMIRVDFCCFIYRTQSLSNFAEVSIKKQCGIDTHHSIVINFHLVYNQGHATHTDPLRRTFFSASAFFVCFLEHLFCKCTQSIRPFEHRSTSLTYKKKTDSTNKKNNGCRDLGELTSVTVKQTFV